MPVISRFNGIALKMYPRYREHEPPHIHAIYGECMGMFSLLDGNMFEGDIPKKYHKKIRRFILYYKDTLLRMWNTQEFELLLPIE